MTITLLLLLASAQPETREQVCAAIVRQASVIPASFKVIGTSTRKDDVLLTFETDNAFGIRVRGFALCEFHSLKFIELPFIVTVNGALDIKEIDHLYGLHLKEKQNRR
jgi:hypothetical protein